MRISISAALDGFSSRLKYDILPNSSGVYAIFCGSQLLYIGQTKNLRTRASCHICIRRTQGKINYFPAAHILIDKIRFRVLILPDELERKSLETSLIVKLVPPFNCIVGNKRHTLENRIGAIIAVQN